MPPTHPVRCPSCRTTLDLPAHLLGTVVRCGGCNHAFTAPLPAADDPPSGKYRPRRDDEDDDDRPRRRPAKPAAKSPVPLVLGLVAAGALVFLAGLGVVGYLALGRGTDPGPPPLPADGKELAANVLKKAKAATARVDVTLGDGDEGNGTGFLVHPDGLIVTNAHVVGYSRQEGNRPARRVSVVFNCGEAGAERRVPATVFGADGDADLAVLRIAPGNLPDVLPLGSAAALRETQELFVFGFPLGDIAGKEITVSSTTVSSLRRENGALSAVQVNGGMHPGNSGGPLTDRGGQVVGVAVAGIMGTNINFAIPADLVDQFVRAQIAAGGKVKEATVVGRPRRNEDPGLPPFLPPSILRPPFGPRR